MKLIFVRILYYFGILQLARFVNKRRLVIVTYHGVLANRNGQSRHLSRNFVTEDMFQWQIQYLAKKYNCLTLGEAVEGLQGKVQLPLYPLVITFDDGFKNNFLYAFPILKKYKIPATIFLATGHIGQGIKLLWTEKVAWLIDHYKQSTLELKCSGHELQFNLRNDEERAFATHSVLKVLKSLSFEEREGLVQQLKEKLEITDCQNEVDYERYAFLDWDEIKSMADEGIEFGGHTVNHAILTALKEKQRFNEVAECKKEIELHLGRSCSVFSYPNGTHHDFDGVDKENLGRLGYQCAATQIAGLNNSSTDLFELRRVNIGRGHSPMLFIAQISGVWPLLRKVFRQC